MLDESLSLLDLRGYQITLKRSLEYFQEKIEKDGKLNPQSIFSPDMACWILLNRQYKEMRLNPSRSPSDKDEALLRLSLVYSHPEDNKEAYIGLQSFLWGFVVEDINDRRWNEIFQTIQPIAKHGEYPSIDNRANIFPELYSLLMDDEQSAARALYWDYSFAARIFKLLK